MKTSRAIESFLMKNGPSSVRDLSAALGVSKADIRYNLKLLKLANRISKVLPNLNSLNRGRPSARFILVNQPTVNNLKYLLNLVLTRHLDEESPDQIVDAFLSELVAKDNASLSSLVRINKIIDFLGNLGILATWTAVKTGPQMSIITNPYEKKIHNHLN